MLQSEGTERAGRRGCGDVYLFTALLECAYDLLKFQSIVYTFPGASLPVPLLSGEIALDGRVVRWRKTGKVLELEG